MSFIDEVHNKKTLAARYRYSRKQLYRKLKVMLSDDEIKKEFGSYSSPFTTKQLVIIQDNLGEPPSIEDL